jgi:hypothetical protein
MISLIRRTFGRWFRQEKNSIKRGSKALDSLQVPDEIRDQSMIKQYVTVGCHCNLAANPKGYLPNTVHKPKEWGGFEIDKWRLSACDDMRRHYGFIGHDGIPCLWDDTQERWLPATESCYASAYAALHRAASPPQPQAL